MAHIYFFLRGIKQQVDTWVALAQGVFWQWERINLETNKPEISLVQGALRPSVLGAYEYILPEDCIPEFLSTFQLITEQKDFRLAVLRKIFGCKKIPKKWLQEAKNKNPTILVKGSKRGLSSLVVPGVAVHLIGWKKDRFAVLDATEYGQGKWFQEYL